MDHGIPPSGESSHSAAACPRNYGNLVRLHSCSCRSRFSSFHLTRRSILTNVHDQAITIALQDPCLHPEYLEPLRQDIDNHYLDFEHTAQGLPLLDSFIKESARLTPLKPVCYHFSFVLFVTRLTNITRQTASTRRYAVESHTFSDGTHLNRGDWACTPLIAINKIPEYYPNPEQFGGFRFTPPEVLESLSKMDQEGLAKQDTPSKLVDTDHKWLMFGTGKQAW